MSVEELKAQLQTLSDQRAQIELDIAECTGRLNAAGAGLGTSLIDDEGYPKANFDIAAIRTDRHKVITLSNDHKDISRQMEILLHRLHAQTRDGGSKPLTTGAGGSSRNAALKEEVEAGQVAMAVPSRSTRPFAIIDEVIQNSPAAIAGLKLHDRMVRFAHVTGQTPNAMQAVASVLQESEGKLIETEVVRDDRLVVVRLRPQKWSGRGLLGCHLTPL